MRGLRATVRRVTESQTQFRDACMHVGPSSLTTWGSNPSPRHCECGVLATGQQKSLYCLHLKPVYFTTYRCYLHKEYIKLEKKKRTLVVKACAFVHHLFCLYLLLHLSVWIFCLLTVDGTAPTSYRTSVTTGAKNVKLLEQSPAPEKA